MPAYDMMADFVDQLSPSDVKERLSRALNRDRPFRRFKDELYDAPPLPEHWQFFHQQRMIEYAREWLRNEGVDQPLSPPRVRPGNPGEVRSRISRRPPIPA
jgi:hypothetical protein